MTAEAALDPTAPIPATGYGDRVVAVEPGGIETVPLADRHGSPLQLLWTWSSPNLEFATVFVGVISVAFFGLSFWQAVAAFVVGNLLGAVTHGVLSSWGPRHGLPQMVLGRSAFGYWGNLLPAGLNAVVAGAGWFAVNSVSGALALSALTDLPGEASLVIIVLAQIAIAFFGHNLVHAFERVAFPVLALVFGVGAISILSQADPGAPGQGGGIGGFLIAAGAAFGYTAGWNPYATDYTRYLEPGTDRRRVGLLAGVGMFASTTFLMIVGAASMTVTGASTENPAGDFAGLMPTAIGNLVLLGIALGAISANVLNVYSAALSFLTMGVRLPFAMRRALVAVGFGAVGLVIAWNALADAAAQYEAFLLIIAYWVAPWLGVVLVDRLLRRGTAIEPVVTGARYVNLAGPVAMLVAMVVSIGLFSNQQEYLGPVPEQWPAVGDITALVGFVLAAGLYLVLFRVLKPATPAVVTG